MRRWWNLWQFWNPPEWFGARTVAHLLGSLDIPSDLTHNKWEDEARDRIIEGVRERLRKQFPSGHETWCGVMSDRQCSCHLPDLLK